MSYKFIKDFNKRFRLKLVCPSCKKFIGNKTFIRGNDRYEPCKCEFCGEPVKKYFEGIYLNICKHKII